MVVRPANPATVLLFLESLLQMSKELCLAARALTITSFVVTALAATSRTLALKSLVAVVTSATTLLLVALQFRFYVRYLTEHVCFLHAHRLRILRKQTSTFYVIHTQSN